MAAARDESQRPCPPLLRTADSLHALHEVLIKEEWFAERPPLALAIAHPLMRLRCEMWRAHCLGALECCTTTATSYHTKDTSIDIDEKDADWADGAQPHTFRVRVGAASILNPAVLGDQPVRGAAGITRPSMMSPSTVFAMSPFASASSRRCVCSVLPPLSSAGALGAAYAQSAEGGLALRRLCDVTPVVDPSTPLYSLETYTEKVFRLPIGMKLGHVRIITTTLPGQGRSSGAQLVRGFFSHVPAAVTLSAAHRATHAISETEALQRCAQRAHMAADTQPSHPSVVVESDRESESEESMEESNNAIVIPLQAVVEDDWETSALLEEAQLGHQVQPAVKEVAVVSPTAPAVGVEGGVHPAHLLRGGWTADKGRLKASSSTTTAPVRPHASESHVMDVADGAARSSADALQEIAAAVLPPPSAWWLRRCLSTASQTVSEAPSVPLFVHCVEATKQWVDWVDGLQRSSRDKDKAATTVELRGVSLSGWSTSYVPDAQLTSVQLREHSSACRIQDAVPHTLPLRGLHLESTVDAATALLEVGGAAAAWRDSLIALDLPHLRDASVDHHQTSLAHALESLRRLRFLSLNRSTDVRLSDVTGEGSNEVKTLEELRLFGVADLTASALASAGRRCVFLRTVDLSSTTITDVELNAFVFGHSKSEDSPQDRWQSPLVCLEELRLAACHSITRVRALAALPVLRRLTLQASGVRQLDDLLGCDALEELVLTRCEHITELHALWLLPRLRCVEADGVRQLHLEGGLLPRRVSPLPDGDASAVNETTEVDERLFVAPLCRLNLSQAALVHGTAVSWLAAALHDVSGRLHTLTVLLLDHTAIGDDTIEALVGLSATMQSTRAGHVPAATALRELSIAGCLGVHHLGPLGLLPQLTRVVADGAGVEHLEGLQRSSSLSFLSLAHCARVWSIVALAHVSSLRTLDISRTPLNDAGLLRFVFPDLVGRVVARQLRGGASFDLSALASSVDVVPSRVEALRLYQCTSLRYIGCVAHLPCLRRLDLSHTAVFDRGFVGFFARPAVLLHTQLWAAAGPAASWAEEEEGRGGVRRESEMAMALVPDEVALLRAWRRHQAGVAAVASAGKLEAVAESVDGEFVFDLAAVQTLGHVSFAYCAEVRGITPCALFRSLASLDLTGTAVDSAALLGFVNVLHARCSTGDATGMRMSLEMEKDGLRARACPEYVKHYIGDGPSMGKRDAHSRPYTLTSLTLSFCHYITDVRCCATLPSLRHLVVCGTPIDNSSIEALAAPPVFPSAAPAAERRWWVEHQCALQSLDIRYCRRVTDVSSLWQTPASLPSSSSSLYRASSALSELHLGHSGVAISKEELRALIPHSRCHFTM